MTTITCRHCGVTQEVMADRASFWWMHDNHTFTKLVGTTIDEIVSQADSLAKTSPYGQLCEVIVLSGDKELRRVGHNSNGRRFGGGSVPQETWPAYLEDWIAAVMNDPDIPRLLPACGVTVAP